MTCGSGAWGEVGASCLIRRFLFSYLSIEEFGKMVEEENCNESSFTSPPTLADGISCSVLECTHTQGSNKSWNQR